MANIVIYDKNTGEIKQYLKSAHTPDFIDRDDCLINPEMPNINDQFCYVLDGKVQAKSPEEIEKVKTSFDEERNEFLKKQDQILAKIGLSREDLKYLR